MQLVLAQDGKTKLIFHDEAEFNKFTETVKQFLKLPLRPIGLEFDCGNTLAINFMFYPEDTHKFNDNEDEEEYFLF